MIHFRSLTIRLLVALVAPLVVSAILIGGGGAWIIRSVVDYTSDRLLAGSVRAIAESVTYENGKVLVDLPPWSLGLLDSPQRDSVFYSVRQSGRTLTGYASLPDFDTPAIASDSPVFRTVSFGGQLVRQAAVARRVPGASAPVIISVAQTLDSRGAVRGTLLAGVGLMEAGLVGLVALFVWPAAIWSLRPMEGLRRELSDRSTSHELDLNPVALDEVPAELKSVVVAFNTLLGQLEQSVEGVRRFTADASHQMRTPLAILKTHLTLLERSGRSSQDRESLVDALGAVDRLQRLIEQLLGLARADALDEQFDEQTDLARVGRDMAAQWRVRAQAAGANLSCVTTNGVTIGLAAPLVEQIIENLLDNALRYGGQNINISIGQDAEFGVLQVSDDGPGLPAELAQRHFERFARGKDSPGDGSGLGLSIVAALARRSGGTAWIAPTAEGHGLCVRVTFPLSGARLESARLQIAH